MLNSYFGYANFIQGGIHTMKKRFLSIALTLAMVSSMAVGCGSSKSDSADSKKEESAKTEASADTESNQILFNGSSTLAPVITSMATTFFAGITQAVLYIFALHSYRRFSQSRSL